MRYAKYQFSCRFEDNARLPSFKGSLLRGIFGKALREVSCTFKNQVCNTCMLNTVCLYAVVFESSIIKESSDNKKAFFVPHPFVLAFSDDRKTEYKKGERLNFNLLLFGDVNEKLPYFIYTFHRMGENGIGKMVNGKRSRFSLDSVTYNDETIYSKNTSKVLIPEKIENLCLNMEIDISDNIKRFKLIFESPLRLKFQNQLTADLPFHVMVRSMLRRISSLLEAFDDGEPDIDYRALIQKAMEVNTVQSDLVWSEARRYSARQKRTMQLGGVVGSVIYDGELSPFIPLIKFCEQVHIGKQTSFGLGKFRTEVYK